ncbi:GNAT family N-acetyltransferase [Aliiroseovarius sp. F47248L]|uniref:GNAT family N-acetyltransferase n=1 Tax=Aliiroseovarius sp. F47248L TaxID=2926420 RepID=UPI001FF19A9E|nr:GNAT family N-acetyltransferase [Aliiroseovarius sp. F47248L]MCK0137750.1 GNAT family N-acetyltransferase [Aliiroseovarius sp. F47248L]
MLKIERARFPQDTQIVAKLFLGYIAFLFERSPEERENIQKKYDPNKIDDLVTGFAQIHARPHGDLLIAYQDGKAVGCGMMRRMEESVAEIQRVFVTHEARGLGAGELLTLALMEQARKDGHKIVRLDTGRALVEASGLYEKLGFKERTPYHQETPYLDHLIRYYERPL